MNIEEYRKRFPTAKSMSVLSVLPLRLDGTKCPICGGEGHIRKPYGRMWRCTTCKTRTPIWETDWILPRTAEIPDTPPKMMASVHLPRPIIPEVHPDITDIYVSPRTDMLIRKIASKQTDDVVDEDTAIFVRKANRMHKAKFDYSDTTFVDETTEVTVNCRRHGPFRVLPVTHLSNRDGGCELCMRERKTSAFIENAKKVHGDRYGYEHTVYTRSNERVRITCPVHGDFRQRPSSHLQGHGCPKCERMWRVMSKIKKTYRDKYHCHYPNVVIYKSGMVEIVCPKHGPIPTVARRYWKSECCPKCHCDSKTDEFVRNARKVHGDRYDYSKVVYVKSHEKIRILCHKHGEFRQTPNNHLRGCGCPTCARKFDNDYFINKARKIHGDKYDYSKVEYINAQTKVHIICPKHGVFQQMAHNHLAGHGCRHCGHEKAIAAAREYCAKIRRLKKKTTKTRKRNDG